MHDFSSYESSDGQTRHESIETPTVVIDKGPGKDRSFIAIPKLVSGGFRFHPKAKQYPGSSTAQIRQYMKSIGARGY